MGIILAKTAGFCFGVKRAVDKVYAQAGNGNVYTFGPIIHNEEVVKDLEEKGVRVINDADELSGLEKGTIIIRSHGVAKNVYDAINKSGFEIIDATCPFVLKIHRIVEQKSKEGYTIIVIGNEHHPEVEGIVGWSVSRTCIIDSAEKAEEFKADDNEKLCVVSQTQSSLKGSILTSRRLLYHKRHLITRNLKNWLKLFQKRVTI